MIFRERGEHREKDSVQRGSRVVQVHEVDVEHSCTLACPSGKLLFFLAPQCMRCPKCMTYTCVYATWILPHGICAVSCFSARLVNECLMCSFSLFWFGRRRLGARAEDVTGVRVTKASYCIVLKSVISWQEFLLRQQ